jgi:hypothetical protein
VSGGNMRLVWDINITTIIVFVFGCIAFYLGVLRTADKVRALEGIVKQTQVAIETWKLDILNLRAQHNILKEEIYSKYLPRAEFESAVGRLFDKIEECRNEQIKAINRVDDRLLGFIKDRDQ